MQVVMYHNRKYYYPEQRRHTTLKEILEAFGRGEHVLIKDNKSGANITQRVISKAVYQRILDNRYEANPFVTFTKDEIKRLLFAEIDAILT